MHATHLLNNYLYKMCQGIHKRRLQRLMTSVRAVMTQKRLSVTGIGRAIQSNTTQKHNIKRADRLIGSAYLNQERLEFYRALAKWILRGQAQPIIIVDWSDLMPSREYHLIRAAIPVGGRTLTVYEEVHPEKYLGHPRIHRHFLQALKQILPVGCCPIFITDAGFGNTWYQLVEKLGWHWLGRLRRRTMVMSEEEKHWDYSDKYHACAIGCAQCHGLMTLSRSNPQAGYLYTYKKTKQHRVKRNHFGQQVESKHSKYNAKRNREPWVLVSSLNQSAKSIIRLYSTRMQIEESFRDVKNVRWGLCLSHSKTYTGYRFENLLLIANLATFATWLIGLIAELKGWARHYQANTISHRKVLSTFYLGGEVIKTNLNTLKRADYKQALLVLRKACQQEVLFC